MTTRAKGLYAPRLVDIAFAVMGIGSATLIVARDFTIAAGNSNGIAHPLAGLAILGLLAVIGLATCLYHHIDRRGWDDYMGQIVTQSAMIAMVIFILFATVFDFLLGPALETEAPAKLIHLALPVACGGWAMGYGFLRWKGTNT